MAFWNRHVVIEQHELAVVLPPQVVATPSKDAQMALMEAREASQQIDRSVAMTRQVREELAYLFDKNHVGQSIEDSFRRKLGK